MNQIFTKDKMIDTKEYILDYLAKNRSELKRIIMPIIHRRNEMYKRDPTDYWDEINESYDTALFMQIYDSIAEKIDIPIDELYVELSVLNLSEFFEPSN